MAYLPAFAGPYSSQPNFTMAAGPAASAGYIVVERCRSCGVCEAMAATAGELCGWKDTQLDEKPPAIFVAIEELRAENLRLSAKINAATVRSAALAEDVERLQGALTTMANEQIQMNAWRQKAHVEQEIRCIRTPEIPCDRSAQKDASSSLVLQPALPGQQMQAAVSATSIIGEFVAIATEKTEEEGGDRDQAEEKAGIARKRNKHKRGQKTDVMGNLDVTERRPAQDTSTAVKSPVSEHSHDQERLKSLANIESIRLRKAQSDAELSLLTKQLKEARQEAQHAV